jgi:hypothetical protein
MPQANKVLALAPVVRDLAARARLVAGFLHDTVERERMLRCAEGLEEEFVRLEALALLPAMTALHQEGDPTASISTLQSV